MSDEQARNQWLETRKTYIGGSDVYELLNRPQYGKGCVRALAYRKLGAEPDFPAFDEEDEALLTRGEVLEPIVANMYEQQTGRKLRRPPTNNGYPRPHHHAFHPWAGVSTDRFILEGSGGVEETGDLEIKTRAEGPWWRVKRKGPFEGDLLQLGWSNWVNQHSWGALAILGVFGSLPLIHFDERRDRQLEGIFVREGEKFANTVWGKKQLPDPPFPATDSRCKVCVYRQTCRGQEIDQQEVEALRQIKSSTKPLVEIHNAELSTTLWDIEDLKRERDAIEEALVTAKDKAIDLLGTDDAALVRGFGKAYVMPVQMHYLDAKRLKAEMPDIYQKYFIQGETGHVFLRLYANEEKSKWQVR